MRLVVGHANPDFDAYASTVAATRLNEGALGVFLGTQNANVRAFHNLHEEFLSFTDLRGLDLDRVESVIMVDTRDPGRIGELGPVVEREGVEVIVYDHHPPQEGDLVVPHDHSLEVGATTSILVHEMKARGIEPTALEASLFLLGIHEDTGSLTYPNSTAYDADAAAWLMAIGADLEVVNRYLARTLDPQQKALLEELERTLEVWEINGQQVAVGTAVSDVYVDSASVLTHYVVEDMGFRVAVAIVAMPERLQVVARSRIAEVDVGAVMSAIGGGGHPQAASAGFRDLGIPEARDRVRAALERVVVEPLRARDIMSAPVRTIAPDTTMRDAGQLMARWGHGGLPVLADGELAGLVTRKDVDKAARHGLDHAPVRGFIGRGVVTVGPETTLSDLERLLASRGIGRVPVVSSGAVVGIVTRKDVLRAAHGDGYLDTRAPHPHREASDAFIAGFERLLPDEVSRALHGLGELAGAQDLRIHLVGGFVRDMLLGRKNLDIDVVVEGDGVAFGELAARALGVRVKVHRRFGTAVLVFSRDLHVDIASSRAEYYTKPGALPTVERSGLRQDLFRRDFSINAMAACIDPDCFGAIADPFGGLDDLSRGRVRVLHALSFVDDPTRVLRACRFEVRYGFSMEPQTEQLARQAVELGLIADVSGARIREELFDICAEERPWEVLARLSDIGALADIVPAGTDPAAAAGEIEDVLCVAAEAVGASSRPAERRRMVLASLGSHAGRQRAERWVRHLRIGREDAMAVFAVCEAVPTLRALDDGRGMRASRLARMLGHLTVEALAVAWARGTERARRRIEHYVRDIAHVRPAVSGTDLIAMGASPGEGFSAILAQARDARLDGRVVGREAELENLRRLAVRAGLIPTERNDA